MNTIRTILIDDEQGSRSVLKAHLNRHCNEVEVIAESESADEAFEMVSKLKPDLLFLDIKMPVKNGFDLLRMFEDIDFHVVFVSGFNEYAIQAFDFNAIDYILKPIDYVKLISSVKRVKDRIDANHRNSQNVLHFVDSLDERNELIKKITLHHNDKVHVLDVKDVVYIEAMRGYAKVAAINGETYISAKSLKEYEKLLEGITFLLKANKSVIINTGHIANYSKGISCFITMKNDFVVEVSRRKKTEIIQAISRLGS